MGAVIALSLQQWFYCGVAEGMTKDKKGRKGKRLGNEVNKANKNRVEKGKLNGHEFPQVSQIMDKVIGDSLKPVATC